MGSRMSQIVLKSTWDSSPYAGGVQVGSPEPPFKINDIHSMHVIEVLVYTHFLAYSASNLGSELSVFFCHFSVAIYDLLINTYTHQL